MSYEFIIYEHSDRIVTITINRPERLNAVHPPTTDELADAWERFRNDDDAWIAILTGAGERAFSAGNDLKYAAQVGSSKVTAASSPQPGGLGGHTRTFTCWKPIIAAVNGYALGGGFEMALACDVIIAADHARFGLPEPTVGFMASSGGAQRLPRSIPFKVAMGYMLTARQMSATEALRWGLVNEIVPHAELMTTAHRWAEEILRCAPLSIRATKEAATRGYDMPLIPAIEHIYHNQLLMMGSEDFVEGPLAFAEKRAPRWTARPRAE